MIIITIIMLLPITINITITKQIITTTERLKQNYPDDVYRENGQ